MKMRSVNKTIRRFAAVVLAVCACAVTFGCGAAPKRDPASNVYPGESGKAYADSKYAYKGENAVNDPAEEEPTLNDREEKSEENPFVKTADEATSTFSTDVDTASYALFRSLVNSGYGWNDLNGGYYTLRTEEMVNYFDYDCPSPEEGKLFGMKATLAKSPYSDTHLLKLTLATEKTEISMKNNLVFLIDVSGSMRSENKLPLLKKAFRYLVEQLSDDDVVSIVTYSGREEIVLSGCKGGDKQKILSAIDSLDASGVTNGEAGLRMAYSLAADYFIEDGNNRIFLASDGDLNVGITSDEELKKLVEEERESGVYLSVLGFGQGNYKDNKMETLADNGNGVYYYIDGETEAKKVFEKDLFSTLYTVASDVKLQITFNPDVVESYRLVGYENRKLTSEDFEDDRKDAGELGAGHKVTAFYEIVLKEGFYARSDLPQIASLAVRHKKPGEKQSALEEYVIGAEVYTDVPDNDFLFAAAVVECSLLMRNSEYKGNASVEHLTSLLKDIDVECDVYKTEFKTLIEALNGR